MAESCSACACEIVDGKAASGAAVIFSGKSYCAECAALILPPEEIAKLTQPQPAKTQSVQQTRQGILASDDDVFGEGEPTKKHVATPNGPIAPTVAPAQPAVAPAAKGSGRTTNTKSANVSPSRKTSVASGVKPRKGTAVTGLSGRDERGGRENSRGRQRAANSTGLYLGLGVGAVALCVIGYFVVNSGKNQKPVAKKSPAAESNEDPTSSTEYARRAEAFHDKKDSKGEVEMWSKAAAKAEKEKNFDQAKIYQMKSITAVKASKLNEK